MCIIIVKPRGVAMPSMSILRTCFDANPDGFGLAYTNGDGNVHIRKGAMSKSAMNSMFKKLPDFNQENVIMHFRRATDGEICKGNCHPFPLTNNFELTKGRSIRCQVAVAHNGIIKRTLVETTGRTAKYTDTQQYIVNHLSKIGLGVMNKEVLNMLPSYATGKFAFLSDSEIFIVGDFTEDKGVYYSNSSYKTYVAPVVVTKPALPYGDMGYLYSGTQSRCLINGHCCGTNKKADEPKGRQLKEEDIIEFRKKPTKCDFCGTTVYFPISYNKMELCFNCHELEQDEINEKGGQDDTDIS